MPSAEAHAHPIDKFIERETIAGRIVGPLGDEQHPKITVNRMGAIPKSTPGKWQVIVDLSSSSGHSINDGIGRETCSTRYASVDDAAEMMTKLHLWQKLTCI